MITRRNMLALLSVAPMSLMTSCGTIIYPDRVYQETRGHIDPSIAILDGVGCLLFLIPGLVAFAVDFYTGAIYIPAGKKDGDQERSIFDKAEVYQHSDGKLTQQDIELIIGERTGTQIDLSRKDIVCFKLDNIDQAGRMLARMKS